MLSLKISHKERKMKMDRTNKLGFWIRKFLLEYVIHLKNYSRNTLKRYKDTFKLLVRSLSETAKKKIDEIEVEDVTSNRVMAFLDSLENDRQCSIRTRNHRLSAVSVLAGYIALNAAEFVDWCGRVKAVPKKKSMTSVITYLERSELNEIFNAINQNTWIGKRDHALLMFMYNTGARADEASNIRIGDISFPTSTNRMPVVTIIGKGQKTRICPLWKDTCDEIRSLISGNGDSEYVFLNRRGEKMTRFGIYEMLERYVKKASKVVPSILAKRPTPHTIRHTTATHLLQAGVDINTIRGWLGHVSVDTTNIYAEVDMTMKARAIEMNCPKSSRKITKHWRDDKTLMSFLDDL